MWCHWHGQLFIWNQMVLWKVRQYLNKNSLESAQQPMDNLYVDKDRCIAIKTVADVKDIAKEQ